MKKCMHLPVVVCMMFVLIAGCGKSESDEKETIELTVFAAASMTETLTELADSYKEIAPDITVTFNFDSSGTLKTQIDEGAYCDIFVSASPKQMDELETVTITDTRIDLLENKVALAVPEGNLAGIGSYDDLVKGLRNGSVVLSIGNADVPVGQYTQNIFEYLGLNEEELAKSGSLTYGSNAKEVTTQVAEGMVDCGIVYATDAYSAGLTVIDTATAEMCGQVIYPAAVLNMTQQEEEARTFLEYLTSEEAIKIFEKVGFTPIS